MDPRIEAAGQIRGVIARELQLPITLLAPDARVDSVGLDSLGLAQSVVAVEEALGTEVDTAHLSAHLRPEMTVGELTEVLLDSLAVIPRPAGSAAG